MQKVCGTSDLEIGWGYMKQVEIVGDDRSSPRSCLRLNEGASVDKEDVMSQQLVRQAARRSALNAQALLRKERADRNAGSKL